MDVCSPTSPPEPISAAVTEARNGGPRASSEPGDDGALGLANLSIGLAIVGLLPVLPLIGSLAATVCAAIAYRCGDQCARSRSSVGLALGILGLVAPLAFLLVYCGLLGYPFPLHRYRPG
jgi:hypothetical protein